MNDVWSHRGSHIIMQNWKAWMGALFLCACLNTQAHAAEDQWVFNVGYASAAQLSGTNAGRGEYASFWAARRNALSPTTGAYMSLGVPDIYISGSGTNRQRVFAINAGLTHQVTDRFMLFGGPGYSHQSVRTFSGERVTRSGFNANAGFGYFGDRAGISLQYDSGPRALGLGVTFRHQIGR